MCCYLIIIRFLSELANAKTGAGRAVGLDAFATLRLLGLRFYFHLTPGSAADAAAPGANNLSLRYTGLRNSAHFRSRLRAYWRFAEAGAYNTPTNSDLSTEMFNNAIFYFLPTLIQAMVNALFDLFLPADLKQALNAMPYVTPCRGAKKRCCGN